MYKYSKKERLRIGKEVYDKRINRYEAAIKYDVDPYTIRDYFRFYKATLAVKNKKTA